MYQARVVVVEVSVAISIDIEKKTTRSIIDISGIGKKVDSRSGISAREKLFCLGTKGL